MAEVGLRIVPAVLPDVGGLGVVNLGGVVRAGIGISDVTYDGHDRDHFDPTPEITCEIGIENRRAKTRRRTRRIRALIDRQNNATKGEIKQAAARESVAVSDADVEAVRLLGVGQPYKPARASQRLPETDISRPEIVLRTELMVDS